MKPTTATTTTPMPASTFLFIGSSASAMRARFLGIAYSAEQYRLFAPQHRRRDHIGPTERRAPHVSRRGPGTPGAHICDPARSSADHRIYNFCGHVEGIAHD